MKMETVNYELRTGNWVSSDDQADTSPLAAVPYVHHIAVLHDVILPFEA
jgi:hypothetical protein